MTDNAFRAIINSPPVAAEQSDDEELLISSLEHAPTGAPMIRQNYIFLLLSGIVLPAILLVWGWS